MIKKLVKLWGGVKGIILWLKVVTLAEQKLHFVIVGRWLIAIFSSEISLYGCSMILFSIVSCSVCV